MSIWQGSNMIAGSGGGGIANYDGKSITENSMEEIQTVGVINSRDSSTAVKTWTGTKAQYDAIVTKDPNTLYNITDDTDVTDIRALGQIVQSTIPLVDAGLHLLDGSVIAYGSYSAFVTYIAGLVSNYPDLFIAETAWQQSVTTYGVCGKFVYDSTNNTVRLPKITGFTEGTTDVTALGDLVEAGLPNIEGSFNAGVATATYTGAFGNTTRTGRDEYSSSGTGSHVVFDASLSNPIYGNSTTVQPQSIKVLYYICIATYPKTQIEVDIDEIATDLNGKADIDLSNMNPTQTVKNTIVGWGMPDYANATDVTSPFTAPSDGYIQFYHIASQSSYPNIDGFAVDDGPDAGANYDAFRLIYPIAKGSIFTDPRGRTDSKFIPLKGVN